MLCRRKMFLFHCDVIKLSTRKPRRVRNKTTKFRQKNILNDRIIFNLGDKLQDRGGSKGANQDLAPPSNSGCRRSNNAKLFNTENT